MRRIIKMAFSIRELSKLSYYAIKKNNGEEEARKNYHIGVFLALVAYYVSVIAVIISIYVSINGPTKVHLNVLSKAILGFIMFSPFYFFIKILVKKKYSDFDMNEDNYFNYTSKYSFGIIVFIHLGLLFIFFLIFGMSQNYLNHGHF